MHEPLVSIGVPTYNRAHLLERALNNLAAQDYPHLEIVVSDNGSTDETADVCARMQEQYPFIRYHRNIRTVPPFDNFKNALLLSKGPYFMWAADDDLWESDFVSTLVHHLKKDADLVLVAAEAQYVMLDGFKLPFFAEGKHYYKKLSSRSQWRRLRTVITKSYGNLIYGLYRREALVARDGRTVLDSCRFTNEIPIFIEVAARGSIQVCDKVLWYKTVALPQYLQAAREYDFVPVLSEPGSDANRQFMNRTRALKTELSKSKIPRPIRVLGRQWRRVVHHVRAWADAERTIRSLKLNPLKKITLLLFFSIHLTGHLLKLLVVWPLQASSTNIQ